MHFIYNFARLKSLETFSFPSIAKKTAMEYGCLQGEEELIKGQDHFTLIAAGLAFDCGVRE